VKRNDVIKTLEDFTEKEVKQFDEMHKVLTAYNASLGTRNELPLPPYSDEEMAEYSGYRQLIIAKKGEESLDRNIKQTSLPKLKTLGDFTDKEIKKFDEMLKVLAAYNASLGTKKELPLPQYTDTEMAEFSGYRELVIAKECEE
jgi:phage regulator Rha-like protein